MNVNPQAEAQRNDNIQLFENILSSTHAVSKKISKLKERINLLEKNLKLDLLKSKAKRDEENSKLEETYNEYEMNLGNQQSMSAVGDLLEDANLSMNTLDDKHKGYLITYQELLSIQFLYVNYQILSEEFNQMQQKKVEYLQYKLNYEENKAKWDLKIAVQAGDAQDRMKELIECH